MPLSPYCIFFDDPSSPDHVIFFSTRTAAIIRVARDFARDIEKNTLSVEDQESLSSLGFFVSNREQEKQELLSYIDQMNATSRSLKLIIVLNLDCNLACRYCFEGSRKGNYFLSEKTAAEFYNFVSSRIEKKEEIIITFYGGEPLLSSKMIAGLSREMRAMTDREGIEYRFNLITNGTLLTRPVVEHLKPLGLASASVTLDGPRDSHDGSRPFKSGKGSFDMIVRNIQDVCDLIDLHVGGNFTRTNFAAFPGLLDALVQSELGPDRLASVRFDPVFNEGREFSDFRGGCLSINEPWLAEAGTFLRREILSRGFRTGDVQPAVCMIERQDHLVVNWDGALYKCTGLIGRKEFCAGTVKAGISDYAATHNLGSWKNSECLECAYLPLCFGGCRYMKLIREGSMQGIDCKRDYFDKSLQALVLQDLKLV